MIFDLDTLDVTILKKFDGTYNYFNPSSNGSETVIRRESKYNNNVLVSDIISSTGDVILEHFATDKYLCSYEDARVIDDRYMSVCVCRRDINDLVKIVDVQFQLYDKELNVLIPHKTQNAHFEKHWQYYEDDVIIYHVNPFTTLYRDESIIKKTQLNWAPWITRYGNPGLSTNVFDVYDKKYLMFHSYIQLGRLYYKYYVGLIRLDKKLNPIGYSIDPLFESNRGYSDCSLLNSLWNWRKTDLIEAVKYEVIFPMSVNVTENDIVIHAGINDCSAGVIKININGFVNAVSNAPFILL